MAALLAAYVMQGILQQPAPPPAQPVVQKLETVDVLIASRNIVTGEKLSSSAVQWVAWPRDLAGGNLITKDAQPDALDRMATARARLPMFAGEPILEGKVVFPKDRNFMSAVLPPGMRAVSVGISEVSAASGFILPNDRVDVVLTRKSSGDGANSIPQSETVLSNVRVLAINQTIDPAEASNLPDARTAVLELYPRQAEVLTSIQATGNISLVLRSLADAGGSGSGGDQPKLSPRFGQSSGPVIIRYGVELGSQDQ